MATSKVSFFKYDTLAEYENAKATSVIDPVNSVVFVASDKSIYLNGVKYTGNPRFVGVPKILYNDPTFKTSKNYTVRYNNYSASVTENRGDLTRVAATDDCPTDSKYMMRFTFPANGNAVPGLGGFSHNLNSKKLCVSRPNAIFVHKFIAKVPEGYTIRFGWNYIGDNYNYEWLTSNKGTGKFQEYEYVIYCGSGVRSKFFTFSYVYFSGPKDKEFVADIAFSTVYDYTDSLDIQEAIQNITAGSDTVTPTNNTISIIGSNGISVSGSDNKITIDGSKVKGDNRYIRVVDSRDTNESPKLRALDLYGIANISADFKYSSVIGNPPVKNSGSSYYSTLLTVAGGQDSSDGYPTQLSIGDGLAYRTGISDTEWSDWTEFYHTGNLNWNTLAGKPSTFKPSSHSHSWNDITDKPTIPKIPTIYISGKSTRLQPDNDNDIVFKAGNNITLDGSGSTLTISATGGSGPTNLSWDNITNKPTVFPTNWANVANKPSTYTPSSHTHKWSDITDKPVMTAPSIYAYGPNERITPDSNNDYNLRAGANVSFSVSNNELIISTSGSSDPKEILWENIKNKPSTFPPSKHTNTWANITNKPTVFPTNWANVANKPTIPEEPRIYLRGLDSRIELDSSNDFNFEAGSNISFEVVNGGLRINSTGGSPGTSSVAWSDITGKPSTFTPSSHTHSWESITGKPTIPSIPAIYVYGPEKRIRPDGSNDYNIKPGSNISFEVSNNALTINATGGSSSVSWSDITNKPTIPTIPTIYAYGPDARISADSHNDYNIVAGSNISFSVSDNKLTINATGGSSSVNWSDIKNKPSTFPASSHSHSWSSITGKPTYLSKWSGSGGSSIYPTGDNSSTIIKTSGKMQSANGFFETSDSRLKDVTDSLQTTINNLVRDSFIKSFNPIKYTLKEDKSENKAEHIGLIAQEVELYYPELVTTNEDGYKSLDYAKLSVIALAEIKVLKKEINDLKKKIDSMK